MAAPSVTYTFINGQTSDGTQVNTNFTDVINSLTDGTKDLTINKVTTTAASFLIGTTDGSESASGKVGQFSDGNPGSPVTPGASGSWITITSLSLGAGKWEIEANGVFQPGTIATLTRVGTAISLTTNAIDDASKGNLNINSNPGVAFASYIPITRRVNSATSFTVYLVGILNYAILGTATWSTDSYLRAVRMP